MIHFNNTPHFLTGFDFTIIEEVINHQKKEETLLIREAYLDTQLDTFQLTGLNKKCQYRAKRPINYNYNKKGIHFNVN